MFLRRNTVVTFSDEELVAQVKAGQNDALAALWDRYARILLAVGMKYLRDQEQAKDLVVELFATLPATIGKHEILHFRPWLHTVMRNRCLMHLRRQGRVPAIEEQAGTVGEEDETALREADLQALEAAMAELNEAQGKCLRLFYFERMSYEQVAQAAARTVDEVRSHLQNGRRNLRLIMQRNATRHG